MISSIPFTQGSLSSAQNQSSYTELISGLVGAPSILTPNVEGRYIRVQLDGIGFLLIAEFEAMGCTPTITPLGAASGLLNFDVQKRNRNVDLNWTMVSEENINSYEIERSSDGFVFSLLEKKEIISTPVPSYYQITDQRPLDGESFYRLKLNYEDGSVYYTENKQVKFEIDFRTIQIYPNPTNEFINITLRELAGKKGTIEIFNSFGQRVKSQNYEVIPSLPATFDVSELVGGVYFVNIKIEGHRMVTKKFVVGRM